MGGPMRVTMDDMARKKVQKSIKDIKFERAFKGKGWSVLDLSMDKLITSKIEQKTFDSNSQIHLRQGNKCHFQRAVNVCHGQLHIEMG